MRVEEIPTGDTRFHHDEAALRAHAPPFLQDRGWVPNVGGQTFARNLSHTLEIHLDEDSWVEGLGKRPFWGPWSMHLRRSERRIHVSSYNLSILFHTIATTVIITLCPGPSVA